ncbi:baculoviral IAP repeat-containing protein 7 [Ambystoma mexicanum]|uniref:baculoviral IAP repeat-containing protein 7 n=1 Tax=Ambystoma mexicanum TaxID=8296 RepID=UPI0037E847C1
MSYFSSRQPAALLGARRRSSSSSRLPGSPLDNLAPQCSPAARRSALLRSDESQHARRWSGETRKDGIWSQEDRLKSEQHRLRTFTHWPSSASVAPRDLARSGFFYRGPGDRVQCFSCGGSFRGWVGGLSPMAVHRRLFPECPFVSSKEVGNSCPHSDSMEGLQQNETEDAQLNNAAHPGMKLMWSRLTSFHCWPNSKVQPEKLSEAGFFYTGRKDCPKCFYCNGECFNCEKGDDPWLEHARFFPRCEFLKQSMGPDYICAVQQQFSTDLEDQMDLLHTERLTRPRQGGRSTRTALHPPLNVQLPRSRSPTPKAASSITVPTPSASPSGCLISFLQSSLVHSFIQDLVKELSNSDVLQETSSSMVQTIDLTIEEGAAGGKVVNTAPPLTWKEESEAGAAMPSASVALESTEEQLRRLQEERVCKICMDQPVCMVFIPCGHLAVCTECVPMLTHCPICRAIIQEAVRTFTA